MHVAVPAVIGGGAAIAAATTRIRRWTRDGGDDDDDGDGFRGYKKVKDLLAAWAPSKMYDRATQKIVEKALDATEDSVLSETPHAAPFLELHHVRMGGGEGRARGHDQRVTPLAPRRARANIMPRRPGSPLVSRPVEHRRSPRPSCSTRPSRTSRPSSSLLAVHHGARRRRACRGAPTAYDKSGMLCPNLSSGQLKTKYDLRRRTVSATSRRGRGGRDGWRWSTV